MANVKNMRHEDKPIWDEAPPQRRRPRNVPAGLQWQKLGDDRVLVLTSMGPPADVEIMNMAIAMQHFYIGPMLSGVGVGPENRRKFQKACESLCGPISAPWSTPISIAITQCATEYHAALQGSDMRTEDALRGRGEQTVEVARSITRAVFNDRVEVPPWFDAQLAEVLIGRTGFGKAGSRGTVQIETIMKKVERPLELAKYLKAIAPSNSPKFRTWAISKAGEIRAYVRAQGEKQRRRRPQQGTQPTRDG